MNIYIIRHGETDANKNSILQGQTNLPLNEDGIRLARVTGQRMKGIKFDACFSSPLDRAIDTAKIILEETGNNIDINIDERIIEFNLGDWDGKSFAPGNLEVPILKMLMFNKNAFWVGKIKNGESAREVCARTQEFLKELATKNYNNVLVSSHGGAIRAMLNMLYENKRSFWQGRVPYNCAVNILECIDGNLKLIEKDKIYYDSKDIVDRFNFKQLKKNKKNSFRN